MKQDQKFLAATIITSAAVTLALPVAASVGVGLLTSLTSTLILRHVQKGTRADHHRGRHPDPNSRLSFAH